MSRYAQMIILIPGAVREVVMLLVATADLRLIRSASKHASLKVLDRSDWGKWVLGIVVSICVCLLLSHGNMIKMTFMPIVNNHLKNEAQN